MVTSYMDYEKKLKHVLLNRNKESKWVANQIDKISFTSLQEFVEACCKEQLFRSPYVNPVSEIADIRARWHEMKKQQSHIIDSIWKPFM